MFHHFHQAPVHHPGQGSISGETLLRILDYVGIDRILTPEAWIDRATHGALRDRDVCLTFDDALRSQFDVALPVLNSVGLRAFWFVYSSVFRGGAGRLELYRYLRDRCFPSLDDFYVAFEKEVIEVFGHSALLGETLRDFVPADYLRSFPFYTDGDRRFRFIRDRILGPDRYFAVMDRMLEASGADNPAVHRVLWMGDDELKYLAAAGHHVGLHSDTHPTALAAFPLAEQYAEYRRNIEHLRSIGITPVAMSHPANSYTKETLAILAELGIRLGFCSNMGRVPGRGPLEYPREDHANLVRELQREHHD